MGSRDLLATFNSFKDKQQSDFQVRVAAKAETESISDRFIPVTECTRGDEQKTGREAH